MGNIRVHRTIFIIVHIFRNDTLYICKRTGDIVLLFVFTSLLFLFISGITWPRYAMPEIWKIIGAIIPSTWGIEGFVRMNTTGASISDVHDAFINLWILTGIYFITACLAYRYQIWKDKKRGFRGKIEENYQI